MSRRREAAVCACGCGVTWMRDWKGVRERPYAPQCLTRYPVDSDLRAPCSCGVCGLTYVRGNKRRYAAECPVQEQHKRAQRNAKNAAYRAKRDAARAAAGLPALKQGGAGKPGRGRCRECEGMAHRRPVRGCICGGSYAPEPEVRARAVLASSAGMALRW